MADYGGQYGNTIGFRFSSTGADKVIYQMKRLGEETGKLERVTTTMNTRTNQFSQNVKVMPTYTEKLKSNLTGLAAKFIGFQAAVNYSTRAIEEAISWGMKAKDEYRSFQVEMTKISAIMKDSTVQNTEIVRSTIETLSVSYGKSVKDLAAAEQTILKAAFNTADSISLLNTVTQASIAGFTTVSKTAQTFTDILNAYNLSASQAAEVSDKLFEAVYRGSMSFEDLESAIGYIIPVASELGVALDEILAALSSTTRQGVHLDIAARGLSLMLQNMINPTDAAKKAANEYGISIDATTLEVKGLDYILREISGAMKEYGISVLPEVIKNTRSLRVAMSLLSDQGLSGFESDLKGIENATGRTSDAMTKMMQTAQTQADILDQMMKNLERDIGEAWSGFDIWWKKTQLWWGTLLSGGNADEAVKSFDTRVQQLQEHYYNLSRITDEYNKRQTVYKMMTGYVNPSGTQIPGTTAAGAITKTDLDNAKEYIRLQGEQTKYAEQENDLTEKRDALQTSVNAKQTEYNNKPWWDKAGAEYLKVGDQQLEKMKGDLESLNKQLSTAKSNIDTTTQSMVEMQPALNRISAGFADFDTAISTSKQKISDLIISIKDMREQVGGTTAEIEQGSEALYTYSTIDKQKFFGKLPWEYAVKEREMNFDRFQQMSGMYMKYGEVGGINFETPWAGNRMNPLAYVSKDIWSVTKNVTGYSGTMKTLLDSLKGYEEEEKQIASATKEHNKELNSLNLAIKINDLEMSKIELSGMQRRHGLTRGEQRRIKELQIEGAKKRIKITESEIGFEQKGYDERLSNMQSNYDSMKNIYDTYNDLVEFDLWKIKDTRDDDLRDMSLNISSSRETLGNYLGWLQEEYGTLESNMRGLYDLSIIINSNEDIKNYFADQGYNIADAWDNALSSMKEFYNFVGVPVPSWTGNFPNINTMSLAQRLFAGGSWWHQGGSYFIPSTGLHMLHKGEQVVPAGHKSGGGTVHVHLDPIKINAVLQTKSDINNFGVMMGRAIAAGIVDGTSSYEIG